MSVRWNELPAHTISPTDPLDLLTSTKPHSHIEFIVVQPFFFENEQSHFYIVEKNGENSKKVFSEFVLPPSTPNCRIENIFVGLGSKEWPFNLNRYGQALRSFSTETSPFLKKNGLLTRFLYEEWKDQTLEHFVKHCHQRALQTYITEVHSISIFVEYVYHVQVTSFLQDTSHSCELLCDDRFVYHQEVSKAFRKFHNEVEIFYGNSQIKFPCKTFSSYWAAHCGLEVYNNHSQEVVTLCRDYEITNKIFSAPYKPKCMLALGCYEEEYISVQTWNNLWRYFRMNNKEALLICAPNSNQTTEWKNTPNISTHKLYSILEPLFLRLMRQQEPAAIVLTLNRELFAVVRETHTEKLHSFVLSSYSFDSLNNFMELFYVDLELTLSCNEINELLEKKQLNHVISHLTLPSSLAKQPTESNKGKRKRTDQDEEEVNRSSPKRTTNCHRERGTIEQERDHYLKKRSFKPNTNGVCSIHSLSFMLYDQDAQRIQEYYDGLGSTGRDQLDIYRQFFNLYTPYKFPSDCKVNVKFLKQSKKLDIIPNIFSWRFIFQYIVFCEKNSSSFKALTWFLNNAKFEPMTLDCLDNVTQDQAKIIFSHADKWLPCFLADPNETVFLTYHCKLNNAIKELTPSENGEIAQILCQLMRETPSHLPTSW